MIARAALVLALGLFAALASSAIAPSVALAAGGCGNGNCSGSETCTNCPADCGVCPAVCGNGTCQTGESCTTCPADCGVCPPVCGNGTCQAGETCGSCPADCGACVVCGNGTCQSGETCSSCPADCGACAPVCGNGSCQAGETCSSCPADCGACAPVCGNGSCQSGETCTSCAADCGACPAVCGNMVCQTGETCSSCPGDCGVCPAVCGNGTCQTGESCSTCPGDCGACAGSCGNGNCGGSENCTNCPTDCGVCPAVCGNGTCQSGESCSSCPGDCGVCPPVCGNGTCQTGETCSNCAADCGACPAVCGTGVCQAGETCGNCPADCGACATCGDGTCDGVENCTGCPSDCGVCPAVCGNGSCQTGETCSSCAADCGACPAVCGDGTCAASETCDGCPADCGVCPSDASFGDCPVDLTLCGDEDHNDCCYKAVGAGAVIIPMDRCHQLPPGFSTPTAANAFCSDPAGGGDDGMFQAYGLVYRLIQHGIPVYWTINPTKDPTAVTAAADTYFDRDIDFWVLAAGASVPMLGGFTGGDNCVGFCVPPVRKLDPNTLAPIAGSYTKKQFPTRGAAFVIAAEDRTRFDEFFKRTGEFASYSSNTLYDFRDVELYEIQAGATVQYLDYYRRAVGPYNALPIEAPGGKIPVVVTLDYTPPRLARQSPANVSTIWLGKAKLTDPAANPGCLTGAFSPATAVYCDMTSDQMAAGALTTGNFDWAWVDNLNGSSCNNALMEEFIEFMTAVPGVKDGHSIFFMESSVANAEACAGKRPLGNQASGLAMSNQGPSEPFIYRYPTNVFSQFADLGADFANGSVGKFNSAGANAYQPLTSLRRLVTEDAGAGAARCVNHKSTSACDGAGDTVDAATYGRLGDVAANGMVFYMGGRNLNPNGLAAQLRMLLNGFLATPAGQVDSTPDSEVVVEVSRSAPVVATVDGAATQFQGTISKIDPPRAVTTYSGAADNTTFVFPHFTGHMRAIDADSLSSSATDFDDVTAFFDVQTRLDANVPPAVAAGCGGPPYTAACRNLFTNLATGALPARVAFTTGQASTLQPLLGPALTVAEATTLINRVYRGSDEDGDGFYKTALGGVDRSTVAVVEQSPLTGSVRPTMIYFGALDGMLHAVCAEVLGPCTSKGQELWAFIPRTQLPLLRSNLQRIDGSVKVVEVFGDPDGSGTAFTNSFHTIIVFQTGSGAPGFADQAPAVIAMDVTDPASPKILWEKATPATRTTFELGVGLNVALGPVKIGTSSSHTTFVQTTNGGTGGTGFVVKAYDTLTGTEKWAYNHVYPGPRDINNAAVPSSGIPGGLAAYSSTGGSTITHVLAPSLYGQLILIKADTGANQHNADPLFSFTTDFRPIGATPTVFRNPTTGKISALAVSGGYADPQSTNWAPDGVEQFAVAMSLDPADYPAPGFNEFNTIFTSLGTSRAFAQAVVAGNEIFIVTDSTDVNSATYGLSGSDTGTLRRFNLMTGAQIGGAVTLPGGSSSVDVSGGGVSYAGAGKAAQSDDFSADFNGTGASTELSYRDDISRLLWISD